MNPTILLSEHDKKSKECVTHTNPLPEREVVSGEKNSPSGTPFPTNLCDTSGETFGQRMTRLRREGAASGKIISKGTYSRAVRAFCLECCGHNPSRRDCGGEELTLDGPCRLFAINTVQKRRATLKTRIRRTIVEECKFCVQSRDISGCQSPQCALYPFGPGRKK